ncbi:protein ImuB [Novosphingobium kunmingense]|uniref:Protein ImuB n=1 Tax=Novosphingobium kunmingense TaxID=1211806 RepID=A0A2N0I1V9_9SPHN|nr:DUF6504 family protein [Novosphingobium kunmingense]PKB25176.1 protein ImuB [Novosphingobium kunmingense]
MARRILAIWLPRLAIERWLLGQGDDQSGDGSPLVLISDTAHGPRVTAATRAGLEAGARPGMMLADVRALCPQIAVAPADPSGDLGLLEQLALWAQRWGPWSALDPPDGLVVDVSGAAHLFGGEDALLADARRRLAARGLSTRLAIAPTAGAAWALAHYGADGATVQPGDSLDPLPVAALRLDPAVLTVLRRLGLKRIGDLTGVARDALARRFRSAHAPAANPLIRMDQLAGRVPEPLLPVVSLESPLVQRRLMEPIRHRVLLDKVLEDLCADMARILEGRALGARRLELALWKVDGEVVARRLEVSAASRDAAHLAGLFARKLDDVDAGFGIELARLRAAWIEPLPLAQKDFEASAERQGTSLAACIDRLSVRLGEGAIRRPVLHASHVPERAQRWVAPLDPAAVRQESLAFHARPLKLLDRAEPIAVLYASPDGLPRRFRWRGDVHEVMRAEGPERIAPEWWRERSTVRLRDYYRVEDGEGRRYWIYRHGLSGDGRGGTPDWYLQGLFG